MIKPSWDRLTDLTPRPWNLSLELFPTRNSSTKTPSSLSIINKNNSRSTLNWTRLLSKGSWKTSTNFKCNTSLERDSLLSKFSNLFRTDTRRPSQSFILSIIPELEALSKPTLISLTPSPKVNVMLPAYLKLALIEVTTLPSALNHANAISTLWLFSKLKVNLSLNSKTLLTTSLQVLKTSQLRFKRDTKLTSKRKCKCPTSYSSSWRDKP